MASPSTLTIGLIDEVQRLHVRNCVVCPDHSSKHLLFCRFEPSLSVITQEESSILRKAKPTLLQL